MLTTFFIVLEKIGVLFLLLLIGYFCGKKNVLNDEAVHSLNTIILNIVIPCTVIVGFQSEDNGGLIGELFLCCFYSLLVMSLFFILAQLFTRKLPQDIRPIYSLSCSLTNCGFMGYPLETAMIGTMGVFYGTGYVAVMNLFTFSLGYLLFTHDRKSISLKNLLLRPSIVTVFAAAALLLADIHLPELVLSASNYLASLSVPLPMIIIGYYLSKCELRSALCNRKHLLYTFIRLVLFPLLALGLLLLIGVKGNALMAVMIASSCPVATVVTILAGQFSDRRQLSAELNAVQTVCSMVTLPVMITLTSLFV